MKSDRRRGKADSESRIKLIEAGTQILADEGAGAITARRVASEVGLSHQIVHYYFKSMGDLFVAMVEHGTDLSIAQVEAALTSENPLSAVTELNSELLQVVLGTEMVLYSRDKPLLRETIRHCINRFRGAQEQAFAKHFEKHGAPAGMSPLVATVVMTSVLRFFVLEGAVGVSDGHAETQEWLATFFATGEFASASAG